MVPADDQDPVLIPSLPEPWEGLVRDATRTAYDDGYCTATADFAEIANATHAASRAERDLRVALGDLLRDKWLLNGRDSGS